MATVRPPWTRAGRAGLAAAVLVALVPHGAASQPSDQLVGRPIAAIELIVDGRVTPDPTLLTLLETRVGAPLTPAAVRESIVHLMELDRFLDVQVRAVPGPNGVTLQYDMVALRRIAAIRIQGSVGLPEDMLRKAIAERLGDNPPVTRVPDIVQVLDSLYRQHGYLHAQFSPRTEPEARADRASLVLEVNAGAQLRVAEVDIRTGRGITAGEVQQRLEIRAGQLFDRVELEKQVAAYVDGLKSRGFFEAKVSPQFSVDPGGQTVRVVIDADRGPLVVLRFVGDPLPPERQADLVPIRREGSVDEDLLENSQRDIEDYLRAQGYQDAISSYTRELRDDALTIVFDVHKGPQYRVADVQIASQLPIGEAGPLPALTIRKGDLFLASKLGGEVARIREEYRRRGFGGVTVERTVTAGPVVSGQVQVGIRILVNEGPRTLVEEISIDGNVNVPTDVLLASIRSSKGEGFYQRQAEDDRDAILLAYANRGYPHSSVTVDPRTSEDKTRVSLRFTIREGPRILVDHVLIVGNTHVSSATIERQLTIKPGMPLALSDLVESRRRLVALGLFRQVRITELQGAGQRRDVLVSVEEGPLTTIGYGGGLEAGRYLIRDTPESQPQERLQVAPRGFFEIGRRNLWGGNRSVNLFTRLGVRPQGYATSLQPGGTATGGTRFTEYRVLGNYRQPGVLGPGSDLLVSAIAEQAIRSSYSFRRNAGSIELDHRLSPTLRLVGRYVLDRTNLLEAQFQESEIPEIDRLFPNARLSSFSGSVVRDTRDDPIAPRAGMLFSADGELASRYIGSEIGFAKAFLQAFVYRPLRGSQRVTFAGGARLGMAVGFARIVEETGPDGQPVETTVNDVPAARRFFAGGDSTVRGFANDQLGAPDTFSSDGVSKGGNAELILNGELRTKLLGWLGAVGFIDVGNVWARVSDMRLGGLRPTIGFGLRVNTPLGPLRGDIGFKLNRLTFANGSREPGYAYYVGVGQAF
jgi:outer membrane protein insertion porin family